MRTAGFVGIYFEGNSLQWLDLVAQHSGKETQRAWPAGPLPHRPWHPAVKVTRAVWHVRTDQRDYLPAGRPTSHS